MSDEQFRKLAELYGFAPSRALRELLEAVERMEREACARVCDSADKSMHPADLADAIRARGNRGQA